MTHKFRNTFDSNILSQFSKAMQVMQSLPRRLPFFVKAASYQQRAAKLRAKHCKNGMEVPPLLIISITRRCNLNCTGCYSKLLHLDEGAEIGTDKFRSIFNEASSLGISIILLAGGEPLVRRDVLEVASEFPKIIFPMFTNGLLLDDNYAQFFAKNPHIIPVISLEGNEAETDFRRGEGVYKNFHQVISYMNARQIFWGVSLTLTSMNFASTLSAEYASEIMSLGCKLFFFVEYVPVAKGSEDLLLSETQKSEVQPRVDALMSSLPALFIAFPGDEDQYEGCLAAGRGFMHINPTGKVEPCPFAPFSDTDLRFSTLQEALKSEFLAKIREQHHLLKEGKGGCALWANKELVEELHRKI